MDRRVERRAFACTCDSNEGLAFQPGLDPTCRAVGTLSAFVPGQQEAERCSTEHPVAAAPSASDDIRWQQTFSVDADHTNARVRELYAAREREARDVIVRWMSATGHQLPALCLVSGVEYYADTKKLAAFTADRFFRALAATGCMPVHGEAGIGAAERDSAVMHIPDCECVPTELLFRLIESEAAVSLTLKQMSELVGIAKYYIADAVLHVLPEYFSAAIWQLNAHEVCQRLMPQIARELTFPVISPPSCSKLVCASHL
jgi:hypothetical protein